MSRDTKLTHLHPVFRHKVELLLQDLAHANLPFRLFESFRSPQRQRELYNQGRSKPGPRVTNADAWSSLHQYGVAADFVLHIDGRWSWDDKAERKQWWQQLHQLAAKHGLQPLSWELPHLQLQNLTLAQLKSGHYPAGGDSDWAENLHQAIISWRGAPPAPPLPPDLPARPPLPPEALAEDQDTAILPRLSVIQARVTARDGLRLRAGPGTDFDIITVLASDQQVSILNQSADWSQIDLEGDGLADGYCYSGFLKPLH
ncbi:D-alanyl-D-alanine carboxypeptidase [Arsukibacterium tuosuense]|uniref:D-alanyl-D-alanine carboxypeptidase n=1 Tax=Arsukibacterium tuosuense TaxID=1323745 RepID=A0A285J9G7_9GAMM|nr:M15 family metallopeptidase [Arsukibacterium tuosuense]SNY56842.1 D-alanyl-D-alanine carboxypeptidase [Arsukibacterium tuosuense]